MTDEVQSLWVEKANLELWRLKSNKDKTLLAKLKETFAWCKADK
jgi:hypothetical protein